MLSAAPAPRRPPGAPPPPPPPPRRRAGPARRRRVPRRVPPARLEAITDTAGIAPRIEKMLPAGVRHRQLRVRTMLLGMQLALADRRSAHLTEVHAALTSLTGAD